jgi:hypothetical protein
MMDKVQNRDTNNVTTSPKEFKEEQLASINSFQRERFTVSQYFKIKMPH